MLIGVDITVDTDQYFSATLSVVLPVSKLQYFATVSHKYSQDGFVALEGLNAVQPADIETVIQFMRVCKAISLQGYPFIETTQEKIFFKIL